MADDVPLICDPVPGPPRLVIDGIQISREEARRLRTLLERHVLIGKSKSMYFPEAMTDLQWPDAEFCAA